LVVFKSCRPLMQHFQHTFSETKRMSCPRCIPRVDVASEGEAAMDLLLRSVTSVIRGQDAKRAALPYEPTSISQ
jgi:hypothetical protein